jgi:hypothetical protein
MQLILYPLLSESSKQTIVKTKKQFGHPYFYTPSHRLVKRLMTETGMSNRQVREQLIKERAFLLKYPQYY